MLLFIVLFACTSQDKPAVGKVLSVAEQLQLAATSEDSAAAVVGASIERHGGDRFQNLDLHFIFRQHSYRAIRKEGRFVYTRSLVDETGTLIEDVLTNEGLYRTIDGKRVPLSEKDSTDYSNSVNSVIYFILQPAFLTDPAVQAAYLGTGSLKGQPYHKIHITFRQEGGGTDYEDEFVYWIHRDSFTMDYLAYNYLTNGGGARFREGYNFREAGSLRFADYINYKPSDDSRLVAAFDSLFEAGQMIEVSRIINDSIEVSLPE